MGAAHQCHTGTFVLRTVQHLRRMVRGPPVSGTAARAAFNPGTAVAALSSEPARGLLRGGVVWSQMGSTTRRRQSGARRGHRCLGQARGRACCWAPCAPRSLVAAYCQVPQGCAAFQAARGQSSSCCGHPSVRAAGWRPRGATRAVMRRQRGTGAAWSSCSWRLERTPLANPGLRRRILRLCETDQRYA